MVMFIPLLPAFPLQRLNPEPALMPLFFAYWIMAWHSAAWEVLGAAVAQSVSGLAASNVSGCTARRAPSRAALLSTWWTRIMYAPSETASERNSSSGSTIASSATCVPRVCPLIAISLTGRFIAHDRSCAHIHREGQPKQPVRHLHIHFGIKGLNVVDRLRAPLQHVDSRSHARGHGAAAGAGRSSRTASQSAAAAGKADVGRLQISAHPCGYGIGGGQRIRRRCIGIGGHRVTRAFPGRVRYHLVDVERSPESQNGKQQAEQHQGSDRSFHDGCAPFCAFPLHGLKTANKVPRAAATPKGARSMAVLRTLMRGWAATPPLPTSHLISSPMLRSICPSMPRRMACTRPIRAAAITATSMARIHRSSPKSAPRAVISFTSPPPIAPSWKKLSPTPKAIRVAIRAEANSQPRPPCTR